jgi:hypothetical protein
LLDAPQAPAFMSWTDPLRCEHCAEIIGAYEPLIVRVGGKDRESSLAAEPELPLAGAAHLHTACARETLAAAEVVRLDVGAPARETDAPQSTAQGHGA